MNAMPLAPFGMRCLYEVALQWKPCLHRVKDELRSVVILTNSKIKCRLPYGGSGAVGQVGPAVERNENKEKKKKREKEREKKKREKERGKKNAGVWGGAKVDAGPGKGPVMLHGQSPFPAPSWLGREKTSPGIAIAFDC